MDILIITTELPYPDNSGGRKYTAQRVEMLKEFGHNLSIISFASESEYVDKNKNLEKFNEVILKKKGIKIKDAFKLLHYPYTAINKYSDDIVEIINKMKQNKKIDLIICECPQLLINIRKIKDIPIILTQHNIEALLYKTIAKESKNIIKKLIYAHESLKLRIFEKKVVEQMNVKGITFISNDDINFYNKINKNFKNTIHIPYCVKNVESNYNGEKNNLDKKIVFVGKMDYKPNVDAVVWFSTKIFSRISEIMPKVKFYIVGKNPTEEVKKLSENKNVVITGMVNSIDEYVKECDLFVIPLLAGGGVKIKLFDGIKNKTPIVTTKFGIEGTDFKKNTHVFEANDEKEFFELCINVLNDNYDYNITKRAYELLKSNYEFKEVAKKYNEFILQSKS